MRLLGARRKHVDAFRLELDLRAGLVELGLSK